MRNWWRVWGHDVTIAAAPSCRLGAGSGGQHSANGLYLQYVCFWRSDSCSGDNLLCDFPMALRGEWGAQTIVAVVRCGDEQENVVCVEDGAAGRRPGRRRCTPAARSENGSSAIGGCRCGGAAVVCQRLASASSSSSSSSPVVCSSATMAYAVSRQPQNAPLSARTAPIPQQAANGAKPADYVYFDRTTASFSEDAIHRAKAAQLKLENYYKVAVDSAIERNSRFVPVYFVRMTPHGWAGGWNWRRGCRSTPPLQMIESSASCSSSGRRSPRSSGFVAPDLVWMTSEQSKLSAKYDV